MANRTTVPKKILGSLKTWGIATQINGKYQLVGVYDSRDIARDAKRTLTAGDYKLVRVNATFSVYNK